LSRKQRHARLRLSEAERAKVPLIDYMRPIVADADTGCAFSSPSLFDCPFFFYG